MDVLWVIIPITAVFFLGIIALIIYFIYEGNKKPLLSISPAPNSPIRSLTFINDLLKNTFSLQAYGDTEKYLTPEPDPTADNCVITADVPLILTNNTNTPPCSRYEWKHVNDDTIECIWNIGGEGQRRYVITASSLTPGSSLIFKQKGAPGELNQWKFDISTLTWCLKRDNTLCMYNKDGKLTLEKIADNNAFRWVPVEPIKPPVCNDNC